MRYDDVTFHKDERINIRINIHGKQATLSMEKQLFTKRMLFAMDVGYVEILVAWWHYKSNKTEHKITHVLMFPVHDNPCKPDFENQYTEIFRIF